MKKLNDLEYLKLGKAAAFGYNLKLFFLSTFPRWLWYTMILGFVGFIVKCARGVANTFKDIGTTFIKGNWAVKLSFFLFGFGNIYYGQVMRGLLFMLFELVFIVYMVIPSGGLHWISKCQFFQIDNTVGTVQGGMQEVTQYGETMKIWVAGDDSVIINMYL